MIDFPAIDPILLRIGSLTVRWYSIAYILGIFVGWKYVCKSLTNLDSKAKEDLLFFAIIGLLCGGRMGYVLLYNFRYYLAFPLDIFKLWNGGMSFHGGMLGVMLTIIFCAKKHKINIANLGDKIVLHAPLVIFLVRLANFINGELYGKPTQVAWAVSFPRGGYLPRHPTQLYEAFFEGVVIFIIMKIMEKRLKDKQGRMFLLFVFLYSFFRILIECFREPDSQIGYIGGYFTMGQILSVLILFCGLMAFHFFVNIRGNAAFDK